MIRRRFVRRIALSSAAAASMTSAAETKSVTYHVKGFTCVTCAVGLETILRQQTGIVRVQASYEKAAAHIEYEPSAITESAIKQSIADMGFSVANA